MCVCSSSIHNKGKFKFIQHALFRFLVLTWQRLQCPANASPVIALVTDVCNSCGTNQVNPHALIYEQHLSQDYQVDVHVEQVTCPRCACGVKLQGTAACVPVVEPAGVSHTVLSRAAKLGLRKVLQP